jgi:hypothetical protein
MLERPLMLDRGTNVGVYDEESKLVAAYGRAWLGVRDGIRNWLKNAMSATANSTPCLRQTRRHPRARL